MSTEGYAFTINEEDFNEVVYKVTSSLEEDGFQVVSKVDMQMIMKENLNIQFHPYVIIGICNPLASFRTLIDRNNFSLALPGNVIIQQTGKSKIEILAIGWNTTEDQHSHDSSVKEKLRILFEEAE